MNDLPFTNEWRFFFYGSRLLTYGYYWSNANDIKAAEMTMSGINFAKNCAHTLSKRCKFFVVDIAERAEGGWILIEVNYGQMSGLSECDPNVLYCELKKATDDEAKGTVS